MLKSKKVNKKLKEFDKIDYLLHNAFPVVEQMPTSYLMFLSKRKCIEFNAYYDDNTFVGFCYFVKTKKMIFITYIAINQDIRSKGYGSKILNHIKETNPGVPISLNVEQLDDNATNAMQRIKRVEFYKRNGFYLLDNLINNGKEDFSIMSTSETLDTKAYRKALKKFSFGFYAPKIH